MVPVGSSVMLDLVLAVHSYHVIAYLVHCKQIYSDLARSDIILYVSSATETFLSYKYVDAS